MKIPLTDFGKHGVVSDTLNSALPIGTWSDARNMRFSGIQMEKMLEPELVADLSAIEGEKLWMQGWSDGVSSYLVVVNRTLEGDRLLFWRQSSDGGNVTWEDVSRDDGYSGDGYWDSFPWGDTVIFNNGRQPPQIFNPNLQQFIDLPNWGMISSEDDISNNSDASVNTNSYCKIIFPYRNFLVALGISEHGNYEANTVLWSSSTSLATYRTDSNVTNGGPPSWDYESPATLSGKSEVGIGSGAITCACMLNEQLIIYTEGAATAMQFVGGSFVMQFRRLFNKGAAGQRCAVEFNSQNFVVARDQIYIHDGSVPVLIAKDRVEDEFFTRIGKGGRFGGGDVNWDAVQVVKNPDRKEIYVVYGETTPIDIIVPDCGPVPTVTGTIEATMIWNQLVGSATLAQGAQGLFGVEGRRIMLANQGHTAVTTQNLGEFWTAEEVLPGSSNYRTNKFLFNTPLSVSPSLGTWYVSREWPSARRSGHWWTTDNGDSWSLMGAADYLYSSTCMAIDPSNDNLITSRLAAGDALRLVFTDPRQVGGTPTWTNNENNANVNFDNLAVVGGYLVNQQQHVDGSSKPAIMPMAYDSASWAAAVPVTYTATSLGGDEADMRPWSETYNNDLVMVVRNEGVNVGGATPYSGAEFTILSPVDMIAAGVGVAAPRLQVDFDESIDMARVNVCPDYFITLARPKNAASTDTRLILKWGTDPKSPDMSEPIMVTLPYRPKLNSARSFESLFHVEWAHDHKWVIGFQAAEDDLTKLFVIDLCEHNNP